MKVSPAIRVALTIVGALIVIAAFLGTSSKQVARLENLRYWIDLRNCVAHRCLPELDLVVIPQAQAGLMNFEDVLAAEFGLEYTLAEALTVPLQLSGFRDPGVLASRKALQASVPLDVQAVLNRGDELPFEVASDPAFQMRVAFVPDVEQRADVGVVEGRDRLRLALEALAAGLVLCEAGRQDLDRDAAVEARVAPAPDLAHPTGADRVLQLEGAEADHTLV